MIIKIFQQNDLIKFDKNCSVSFLRVKKKKMDSKGPYGNGFLGFDLFPIKRLLDEFIQHYYCQNVICIIPLTNLNNCL